ncbi:MAG: hypothetical protein KatS3mg109_1299 [Pirellulaceae bacterium]|nr:MAG: hypothetical protein KatS3mg109_1299 [Pirellulaceae bacterium]GIW92723.1 MAG: hypothetical protein KatS3mg110_0764 [Pirellulaceae bacterium]
MSVRPRPTGIECRWRNGWVLTVRGGQSLLEVIAAGTVIAIALVPALRLMRDGMQTSRDLQTAQLLVHGCVSLLEQQIVQTAASWSTGTATGDFASDGRSDVRYIVRRSEATTDGGIPGALMAIRATVWHDRNGNGAHDATEPKVELATKVAKTASYQNAAK